MESDKPEKDRYMQYTLKKYVAYEIENLNYEQSLAIFHNEEKTIYAPLTEGRGTYILSKKSTTLHSNSEIKIHQLNMFQYLKFRYKIMLGKAAKYTLDFNPIYLTLNDFHQRKELLKINRHFAKHAINLENQEFRVGFF